VQKQISVGVFCKQRCVK